MLGTGEDCKPGCIASARVNVPFKNLQTEDFGSLFARYCGYALIIVGSYKSCGKSRVCVFTLYEALFLDLVGTLSESLRMADNLLYVRN